MRPSPRSLVVLALALAPLPLLDLRLVLLPLLPLWLATLLWSSERRLLLAPVAFSSCVADTLVLDVLAHEPLTLSIPLPHSTATSLSYPPPTSVELLVREGLLGRAYTLRLTTSQSRTRLTMPSSPLV